MSLSRYAYESQAHVEVRVARIFNTFGPRMHPNDGRVVSNFIIQALQGKDITIYGDGSQTRSFQFVDDLVEGLIRLMNGNYSQPVNLGNPEEYTVKDFAELIKEITKSNSTIRMLPATKDDPKQRKPDITCAGREIGWKPVVPVRIGLSKAVEYFRQVQSYCLLCSLVYAQLMIYCCCVVGVLCRSCRRAVRLSRPDPMHPAPSTEPASFPSLSPIREIVIEWSMGLEGAGCFGALISISTAYRSSVMQQSDCVRGR